MKGQDVKGLKEKSHRYRYNLHRKSFYGIPSLSRGIRGPEYKRRQAWYCGRLISGHTHMQTFHMYKDKYINLVTTVEQTLGICKLRKTKYGVYLLNRKMNLRRIRYGCHRIWQVCLWSEGIDFKKEAKRVNTLKTKSEITQ